MVHSEIDYNMINIKLFDRGMRYEHSLVVELPH